MNNSLYHHISRSSNFEDNIGDGYKLHVWHPGSYINSTFHLVVPTIHHHITSAMVLIAVYNPVSGDRRAKSVLLQHTLPLLASHSIPIDGVFATEHTSHAGQIVSDIIRKSGEHRIQVVLCSGDGTLHDIINGISVDGEVNAVEFILIPCGTANALYSSLFPPNSSQPNDSAYMLQSLHSHLRKSHARPLYVAVNTISSSASASPIEVLSTVVTSTCLHASILRDSESLREEFPGVDRFVVNLLLFRYDSLTM